MSITLITFEDLFNAWSTIASFRRLYPGLPDLTRYHKADKLYVKNSNNKIELYLRGSIYERELSKEDKEKYIYSYIKKYLVIDGKLKFGKQNNLKSEYVIIDYILDTKTPIVIDDETNLDKFTKIVSSNQYQQIVELGLFSQKKPDGTPFDITNWTGFYKKKFYELSKLECYKPSAYDLLSRYLGDYLGAWVDIKQTIKYIKENNCIWVEHTNEIYNCLKEDNNITLDELVEKACFPKGRWSHQIIITKYHQEIIGYAKKYGYDLNQKTTTGGYLVHIAISSCNFTWLQQLMNNGATLFDKNGMLLPVYHTPLFKAYNRSFGKKLYDVLLEYFKDDKEKIAVINAAYLEGDYDEGITFVYNKDEEIDWSVIQDETIRKKMMEKYMKLISC